MDVSCKIMGPVKWVTEPHQANVSMSAPGGVSCLPVPNLGSDIL